MRPRARGRDDGVVAAQVERLDRVRIERQQRPEGARGRAQALQERGVDRAVREPTLGAALVVDGGEDVGVRPAVADRREHPLGAAQVEQEVVDQRDASGGHERAECKKSVPGTAPRRLASARAPPRDHPPPAPDPARGGGPVRARHGDRARRHRGARPRRALDRRRALRDPRGASGSERRRRAGDRRRDVRRAQGALGVLAAHVRQGARRRLQRQAAGDRLRRRVRRASKDIDGRQHADPQHAQGRQRRPQRHRGRQERRDEDLRRRARARSSRAPRSATGCCRRARRARCGGCPTRSTGCGRCRWRPSSA